MEEKLKKKIKFWNSAIVIVSVLIAIEFLAFIFSGFIIDEQACDEQSTYAMVSNIISEHNNRFIIFEGKQKGSIVKKMIDRVISYNLNEAKDRWHFVKVIMGDATNEKTNGATKGQKAEEFNMQIEILKDNIIEEKTYNITYGMNMSGYVMTIGIEECVN